MFMFMAMLMGMVVVMSSARRTVCMSAGGNHWVRGGVQGGGPVTQAADFSYKRLKVCVGRVRHR
ncbi:exported hypothetical protein [Magnetospirillum molischianum DSM 120]|uniref:Secreted protein n=1 Tax=Magnetospirillum molischianum DSM 120 TaxID=1150626 RepID=H8FSR0_MAGML|nr:exported hypothetical protein [Magnetospirillum molischianum DSM 120]